MKKDPTKILVIDDNPMTVRMLEKVLKMDGYEVMVAYDGTEGVRKAKKEKPFIILLDVIMPDIDGKEVASRLQKDSATKSIPIVFLTITVNVAKDKGEETIEVNGISYRAMAKPMHTRKLLSILRKEVNRRIHDTKEKPN